MDRMEVSLKDGLYLVARQGGRLYSTGLAENEFIYYNSDKQYISYEDDGFIGNTWVGAFNRLIQLDWVHKHKFYYVEDVYRYELSAINEAINFHEEQLKSLYERKSKLTGECSIIMHIAKDIKCNVIDIDELVKRANCSNKIVYDLIFGIEVIDEKVEEDIIRAYTEIINEMNEVEQKC